MPARSSPATCDAFSNVSLAAGCPVSACSTFVNLVACDAAPVRATRADVILPPFTLERRSDSDDRVMRRALLQLGVCRAPDRRELDAGDDLVRRHVHREESWKKSGAFTMRQPAGPLR